MQLELEAGLTTKLLEAIGAAVEGRVVNQIAKTIVFPYVIFSYAAGGDVRLQQRGQGDLRYTVKVVAEEGANGALQAAQIGAAIYEVLHKKTFPVAAPWKVYRIERMSIVKYVTAEDKRQFFHNGGLYRFRMSEEMS